MRKKKSGYII